MTFLILKLENDFRKTWAQEDRFMEEWQALAGQQRRALLPAFLGSAAFSGFLVHLHFSIWELPLCWSLNPTLSQWLIFPFTTGLYEGVEATRRPPTCWICFPSLERGPYSLLDLSVLCFLLPDIDLFSGLTTLGWQVREKTTHKS